MRNTLTIFAVLVALSWGGTLLADPVQVTVEFVNVSPGQNVSVSIGGGSPQGTTAGVYNLLVDNVAVQSFCIDPAVNTNDPVDDYWLIDLPSNTYYAEAAWVILNWGFPGDPGTAANVQMAIWTLIPDIDVTNPAPLPDEVQEMVLYGQTMAAQNGAPGGFALLAHPSPDPDVSFGEQYQDYIVYRTPEPASILLLGLGLFGVGLVGRKYC